jgi:anti-sigma B factor antagonist
MTLKLSARTRDAVAIVDCQGRIIFGDESIALREFVKEQLKSNPQLIINLADVNYIDSGGLGTLVGLYTSARAAGGVIKLSSLTERVGELLQVTKLLTVFEVYDSENEAVGSFQQRATA